MMEVMLLCSNAVQSAVREWDGRQEENEVAAMDKAKTVQP